MPRTRQPLQWAPVDRGNALTRGLATLVVGGQSLDLRTGRPLAPTSGIQRGSAPLGLAWDSGVSPARGRFLSTTAVNSGPLTVFALASRDSTCATDGSNDPIAIAGIACNRSAGSAYWELNIGNAYGVVGDVDKPRATESAAAVYVDGVLASGTAPADVVLLNGRFYAIAATWTNAPDDGAAGPIWMANGVPAGGAYSLNGRLLLGAMWNRVLSGPEIARLSRNPWQVFAEPKRRLWPVHAPTFNPAWARNANSLIGGRAL